MHDPLLSPHCVNVQDPAKFTRVKELLAMHEVIKEARNPFKKDSAEDLAEAAGMVDDQ